MGPGNSFFEGPDGSLYINTPEGPVQVARRPSPDEVKREKRISRVAGIVAVLIVGLVTYCLDVVGLNFVVVLGVIAWFLSSEIIVPLLFVYRRTNWKVLRGGVKLTNPYIKKEKS